jgi:SPP1 family predicted phage head-tail adaptor
MNQYVTILQRNQLRDDAGEFLRDTVFAQTWAAVVLLQGRDLEKTQQIVAEVTHKCTIPYHPNITSDMYLQMSDGRLFQIEALQDRDERKFELDLLCRERNDGKGGQQ